MKSMLSEVDFSLTKHLVAYGAFYTVGYDYAEKLRAALVAALGVIESSGAYEQKYAELAADTGSINQDWRGLDRLKRKASGAYAELETALEPFRVAGDDAKAAPK